MSLVTLPLSSPPAQSTTPPLHTSTPSSGSNYHHGNKGENYTGGVQVPINSHSSPVPAQSHHHLHISQSGGQSWWPPNVDFIPDSKVMVVTLMMDVLPDQNHHIHLCEERGVVRRHQGAPPPATTPPLLHLSIWVSVQRFTEIVEIFGSGDSGQSVEMLTTGSCKLSTYQMDAIALIWDW